MDRNVHSKRITNSMTPMNYIYSTLLRSMMCPLNENNISGGAFSGSASDLPDPNEEHFAIQDGEMVAMKNGVTTKMDEARTLNDGSVVHPNGEVIWVSGETRILEDGEAITLDGRILDHAALMNQGASDGLG